MAGPAVTTVDVLVPYRDEEAAVEESRHLASHRLNGDVELLCALVADEGGNRRMFSTWVLSASSLPPNQEST